MAKEIEKEAQITDQLLRGRNFVGGKLLRTLHHTAFQ